MYLSKATQQYIEKLNCPIDWSEEISMLLLEDFMSAIHFDIICAAKNSHRDKLRFVLGELRDYYNYLSK